MAVPTLGKQEFSENQLSRTGENKKSTKIDFPSRGKTRNQRKTNFPNEGKSKNAENHSSLVSEMQKTRKTAFRLQATDEKR